MILFALHRCFAMFPARVADGRLTLPAILFVSCSFPRTDHGQTNPVINGANSLWMILRYIYNILLYNNGVITIR